VQFTVYLALMALPGYWLAVVLIELPFFGILSASLDPSIYCCSIYAVVLIELPFFGILSS
jgi:hypothetical protein